MNFKTIDGVTYFPEDYLNKTTSAERRNGFAAGFIAGLVAAIIAFAMWPHS